MKNKLWLSTWIILLMALVSAATALAQEATPQAVTDDQVNAIAKQMYCPVCENTPLDVCPTQACAEWRALIRDKLEEGWSEQRIKDYFVEQYGARVLATPPATGLNWLVYIIPPLAFLAGAFILYRAFQSWRAPAVSMTTKDSAVPPSSKPDTDEYILRLEEELRKKN